MTSWMVFYTIIPAPNVHLTLLTEINPVEEPNLGVFKLPHGGVGIKRGDRVAPNNPPRHDPIQKKDRPDDPFSVKFSRLRITITHNRCRAL